MEDYATLRHDIHHSLIKTIGLICRKHMKTNQTVVSIEGLFGVTIRDDHTFLFNIKESRNNSSSNADKSLDDRSPIVPKDQTPPTTSVTPTSGIPKAADSEAIQISCVGTLEAVTVSKTKSDTLEVLSLQPDTGTSHRRNSSFDTAGTSEKEEAARGLSLKRATPEIASENDDLDNERPLERSMPSAEKRRRLQSNNASPTSTLMPRDKTGSTDPDDEFDYNLEDADAETEADVKSIDYNGILVVSENGIYCNLCHQIFSKKNSARRHVNFKHFRMGVTCPYCQRLCRNNNELGDHLIGEHSGNSTPYSCDECKKGFKTRHTLKAHIDTTHKGRRRFRCHLCDEGFHTSKSCRNHLATKHPHCGECGMTVITIEGHVCSTIPLFSSLPQGPVASAEGSAATSQGMSGPSSFRLNKRALGDLAKSVVAHVVSASGVDEEPKEAESHEMPQENIPMGGEPVEIHDYSDSDSNLEPGEIRKPLTSQGKQNVPRNFQPYSFSRTLGSVHTAVQEQEEDEEYTRGNRQTPSPTPSEMSDCSLTYVCDTCGLDFYSQEDYHAHVIQHPWCQMCDDRVMNLRIHRPHCPKHKPHMGSIPQGWDLVDESSIINLDD